jgi:hypothetical protein
MQVAAIKLVTLSLHVPGLSIQVSFISQSVRSSDSLRDLRWVLVFDNVEDAQHLLAFWPTGGHGAIIITTQKSDMTHIAKQSLLIVPLEPLSSDEGQQAILSFLEGGQQSDQEREALEWNSQHRAREIAQRVGQLPLALYHIAGYIKTSRCSLSTFLVAFDKRHQSKAIWTSNVGSVWQYERTLETVNSIAIEEVKVEKEDARLLLNVLAFLDPDSILDNILFASGSSKPSYLNHCEDEFA